MGGKVIFICLETEVGLSIFFLSIFRPDPNF